MGKQKRVRQKRRSPHGMAHRPLADRAAVELPRGGHPFLALGLGSLSGRTEFLQDAGVQVQLIAGRTAVAMAGRKIRAAASGKLQAGKEHGQHMAQRRPARPR
jgi:hypothetical protein